MTRARQPPRREEDDADGDPTAKPVKKHVAYITAEGAAKLKTEHDWLWLTERPRVTQAVSDAAALGDRSENADYIYGKRRLREIDRRLRFLTKRLETVRVVNETPGDPERVFFGAWVTLEDEDGESKTWRIVGADETDMSRGYISMDSPVAKALLGKRLDDELTIRVPKGDVEYTIVGVKYAHVSRAGTESTALAANLPRELAVYTKTPQRWRSGCDVDVLRDGEAAFPAMLAAIGSATTSILFETYILVADATGNRFKDALVARAKAGVATRLIYDAVGSFGLPDAFIHELRTAGVEVVAFNPIALWRQRFRLSHRDHRKILVVDHAVAFTGGMNISDDYAPASQGGAGWHDMHCRVTGVIVLDIARMFRRTWHRIGGTKFPPIPPAASATHDGDAFTRLLDNTRLRQRGVVRRAYLHVIRAATKSILIENAYFLPDRALRRALTRAARRGVDVQIIVPGHNDVRMVGWASLYVCRRLTRLGVKVLRWRGPMMHAKMATIDATWSTIGSYNFDAQSRFSNLELTVEMLHPPTADTLVKVFESNAPNCDPFTEDVWKALPWYIRIIAFICFRLRRFL